MNVRGAPKAREMVLASTPIRGCLTMGKLRPSDNDNFAPCWVSLSGYVLADLFRARVITLQGRHMLISGQQVVEGGGPAFEQRWWCRIVPTDGAGQA